MLPMRAPSQMTTGWALMSKGGTSWGMACVKMKSMGSMYSALTPTDANVVLKNKNGLWVTSS